MRRRFLQIEPVGHCNLRCAMCPVPPRPDGPGDGSSFMSWEVFAAILERHPGLRELRFQGLGEPMLHPRFFEMVEHAAERGIRVSVNTNGTALDRDVAERLARSSLASVHVSVDGATRATFEAIRAGARFARVLRGLALLRRAKERLGGAGPRTRLVMVAMKENLAELPALVRLARRLGIGSVFVRHVAYDPSGAGTPAYARAAALLDEDPERVRAYFRRARDAAAECGVDLRLPSLRRVAAQARTWDEGCLDHRGVEGRAALVPAPDRGRVSRGGSRRFLRPAALFRVRRPDAGRGRPRRASETVLAAALLVLVAARVVVATFPAPPPSPEEPFSGVDDGSAVSEDGGWGRGSSAAVPLRLPGGLRLEPSRWADY